MTRSVFVAGGGGRPRSSPPPAAVLPPRPLLLLLLPLLLQMLASLPSSHASLTVASALTHPGLLDAGGIDAHGSIAYVAGEGVTAIDVTDPDSPKVLMTLADPLLTECKSVYAYTTAGEQDAGVTAGTTKKRLAVACSGSDALILVDAEAPEDLKLLGSVAEPAALKGAAGVVVKGTLAFVAASGAARVVSVDVSRESRPAVLSSVRLSAASTVGLHGDSHLNVGSGPGRRVTILSYTPSGVLMKTGSVKDGRLEGQRSIVHVYAPNPNITFAVTAANGGTFAVINTTVRTRPTVATALQARRGQGPEGEQKGLGGEPPRVLLFRFIKVTFAFEHSCPRFVPSHTVVRASALVLTVEATGGGALS